MTLLSSLLIPISLALFMAINMGGSGVGPSFSAAFGANAIKKNLIPGLFGIMVLVGAIIAGKETAKTMGEDIIATNLMNISIVSIILLSVSISLLIANLYGIPQSTSQATVMAAIAPAIFYGNFTSYKLFYVIIPTWFILPIFAFFISFLIGRYIYKPMRRRGLTISRSNNVNKKPFINILLVIMALYVSFSIGANNVANAAGPVAKMIANELNISSSEKFNIIIILTIFMIAPCFAIGSSIFGTKILNNTGKEIVRFGKFEAIIISFVSGSLLLIASITKGIPTAEVQLSVASILGIGVAKLGYKNIFYKTEVKKFFYMWIIAPIISFTLSFGLTFLASTLNIIK